MGYILLVEVQVVGRGLVGFKNREILAAEVAIRWIAGAHGKQQRQVGIVSIQDVKPPQIERGVAGDGGKECVQEVVALLQQTTVVLGKGTDEFGDDSVELLETRA